MCPQPYRAELTTPDKLAYVVFFKNVLVTQRLAQLAHPLSLLSWCLQVVISLGLWEHELERVQQSSSNLLRVLELYEYMGERMDTLLVLLIFTRSTLRVQFFASELEPVFLYFVLVLNFTVYPPNCIFALKI